MNIISVAQAQSQGSNRVPEVNVNAAPTGGSPWGGFKLSVCDGPDLSGLKQPIEISFNGERITTTPGQNPADSHGNRYVPCNFQGMMIQMQFLINVMLVVGVLAALLGFAYAGWLYVSSPISDKKKEASKMLPKIFWGFVIMLTGWFIVHQILVWLTGNANYLPG
ncbi:MAG TPA: hypothetical protein VF438_00355 [Candidatus Paceibacterota bacterium]